jgi:cell division protein FtsL
MATADWFGQAAVVPERAPRRRPRTQAQPRPAATPVRRTRASKRRLRIGIGWITAFALLLVGVVAVNVAVLRVNMAVQRLDREEADLHAQNQALFSQLSAASAAPRIEAAAQRLGLVMAPSSDAIYVDLSRP